MRISKNKYKKKAVTPVIATVLLIAITIVLFIIIFMFGRGFIGEALQKQGSPIEQKCNEIKLESSYSNGRLEILNSGNIPIYGFDVYAEAGRQNRKTVNFKADLEENKNILKIGRMGTFTLSLDFNPNTMRIYPIILAEKDDSGTPTEYTCEKPLFNVEIK